MITLKVYNSNEQIFESICEIIDHLKTLECTEISGFIEFSQFKERGIVGNSSLVFNSSLPDSIILALSDKGALSVTGSI
tara:strand:- start:1910 stop:2146 length:237 start_codon:yes stop_codon:yes gene_type:complete